MPAAAPSARPKTSRRLQPSWWFGDRADRRPTVPDWAVEALVANPTGAPPLPRTAAWFAAHVMSLGGVFTGRQTDAWLAAHDPAYPRDNSETARKSYRQRFLQPLFHPRFARRSVLAGTKRLPSGQMFAHMACRPAYELLQIPNSRYRRKAEPVLFLQRLLVYDYLLDHPEIGWVGDTQGKLDIVDALDIPRSIVPARSYLGARPGTPRPVQMFFPEHMPLGYGPWRLVFVVPCVEESFDAAARAERFHPLWSVLRAAGIRVTLVFAIRPRTLPPAAPAQAGAVRPVPPDTGDRDALFAQVRRRIMEQADEILSARIAAASGSAADTRPGAGPADGRNGPMEVEYWFSTRLSADRWRVRAQT